MEEKKQAENALIENLLKETELPDVDVDVAGLDVDAILKETELGSDILSGDINIKDDVTTNELLSGINLDIHKTSANDHLIQNIMKEINTEMNIRKKDPKKQLPKFENFFGLIDFLEKKNYKKNEEEENENQIKKIYFY